MRKVLPMWRMCRLLDKNRHEWIPQIAQAKAYDKHKVFFERIAGTPQFEPALNQETYLELLHGEDFQGELKVYQNGLIYSYINEYILKDTSKPINISTETAHQSELSEARAVLRDCISHSPRFICRSPDNMIYLSYEGGSFAADWFGLVKEYTETLGPFKSNAIAVIIGLIPYVLTLALTHWPW